MRVEQIETGFRLKLIVLLIILLPTLFILGFSDKFRAYAEIWKLGVDSESSKVAPKIKKQWSASVYPSNTLTSTGKIAYIPIEPNNVNVIEPIPGGLTETLTNTLDENPSFSIDGKKILFSSRRDGDDAGFPVFSKDIYLMNADGSSQRRLTSSGGNEEEPVLSPDGTKIAFTSDLNICREVFIMDSDGSNQTQLTFTCPFRNLKNKKDTNNRNQFGVSLEPSNPSFTPDGSEIIFSYEGDIWKINTDGTGFSLFYSDPTFERNYFNPMYSPDGSEILLEFTSFEGKGASGIEIIDAAGAFQAELFPTGFATGPVWSPDGSEIAYTAARIDAGNVKDGIHVINVLDLSERIIVESNRTGSLYSKPSWRNVPDFTPPISVVISSPHPLPSGGNTQGIVKLDPNLVPTGGATVNLSGGSDGVINLPLSSVFIPEGSSEAVFPINAELINQFGSSDITATFNSNQTIVTVTVTPSAPDLVAQDLDAPTTLNVEENFTVNWAVLNDGVSATNTGWIDRIYLSIDDQFSSNDTLLKSYSHSNTPPLNPDETRPVMQTNLNIPASVVPQDGIYFLILQVNATKSVREYSGYNQNNFQSFPVQVNRNLPDIIAENISSPAEIEPGTNFTVSWTVKNIGSYTTATAFQSYLYFSQDDTAGNSDDLFLENLSTQVLNPNESVQQSHSDSIPTLPVRPSADSFFYVSVDHTNIIYEGDPGSASENNKFFAPVRFEYRVPDLQTSSFTVPQEVETDTEFTVDWTILNAGNKRVSSVFTDRIYFSLDNQVGNDVLIGTFNFTQGVDPNQSFNRIQNLTIPTSTITETGDYFLYVITDYSNTIDEGANENNNINFQPLRVRRLLRPDLLVSNITAPDTAFFSQTIQVQWTVTNNGQGPTNSSQWSDKLFIGTNPNQNGATQLASINNVSALNAGESYIASATVKIPRGFNGSYYFIVKTVATGNVNEENTNNNILSRPVNLNIPPLPDLQVSNVQAPEQGFAGGQIFINWKVSNLGTGSTLDENVWIDKVYISQDTTLNTNQDRMIGSRVHVGELSQNGDYQVTGFTAVLPNDVIGDWYVFVLTDALNTVYEFTNENNNNDYDQIQPGSPMTILATPPDLIINGQVNAPANAAAGQTITVSFNVRNQGAFDAVGKWNDGIFLSADQNLDENDIFLGSLLKNGLPAGGQYNVLMNVKIPNCLNGNYYLIPASDIFNKIFEFDPNFNAEENNSGQPKSIQISSNPPDLTVTNIQLPNISFPGQQISIGWTVVNQGTGTTNQNWNDKIVLNSVNGFSPLTLGIVPNTQILGINGSYSKNITVNLPPFMQGDYFISIKTDAFDSVTECSFEDNNLNTSQPFNVPNNYPDLQINSVITPNNGIVGENVVIDWTGINIGSDMLIPSQWKDKVFLSNNQTYDSGDVYLGESIINATLTSGQSYMKQLQVQIPNVQAGSYYFIFAADANNDLAEGSVNSQSENNNITFSTLVVLTAPEVDLQVSNVTMQPPFYSGLVNNVSWTVTNFGSVQTLGSRWSDYVILSRDSIYDPTDIIIGYKIHNGNLTGGASYQESLDVLIPNGLTGEYNVFIVSDRNNSVVENNEQNNISTPLNINLQLPPPADLNITNITIPATSNLDDNAQFSWTVQNSGPNIVNGMWTDSIYLSTDTFWDSSDFLVGQQSHAGPLNVSQTYTASLDKPIPPVEPGTYYVIVRTDSKNNVREENEGNNVATSISQTTVTVTDLTLGVPFNTTLITGQNRFFKYNTASNETLLVDLDGEPGSVNELFTKFGSMVSRSNYDFQSTRQGEEDQENVVPNTETGTYFTMVRGDFIPESFSKDFRTELSDKKPMSATPENVTIKAEVLPFTIRTVSPNESGNKGFSTLLIEGAKFQQGATVKLVAVDNSEILPIQMRVSSDKIAAIFDLKGKPLGDYSVVVTNPDNQTAVLNGGFRIVENAGYFLRSSLVGPDATRNGRTLRFTVGVHNDGKNDALLVPILIILPQNTEYGLSQSNLIPVLQDEIPGNITPEEIPFHLDIEGFRVIALYVPIIRGKESVEIGINVKINSTTQIKVQLLPSLLDPDSFSAANSSLHQNAIQNLSNQQLFCWYDLVRRLFFDTLSEYLGLECIDDFFKFLLEGANSTGEFLGRGVSGVGKFNGYGAFAGLTLKGITAIINCLNAAVPPLKLVQLLWDIYQYVELIRECANLPTSSEILVSVLGSIDPNEKLEPAGFGPEKFVPINKPMLYTINFENLPDATAPAQKIRITDQLPTSFDWRTFRLKEIGFKQNRFEIPENRAFYQNRLQLGEDLNNLQVEISSGLNIINGEVSWTLTAIDPQTGEQPIDPTIGILPPNNANKDGEGYVTFIVEPLSTMPSRTEINNNALIIFDNNEPIITNTTVNLLDSGLPFSSMVSLPSTTDTPEFTLSWDGDDVPNGSGFNGFEIYYSENNGPPIPFFSNTIETTTTFKGKWGKNYSFYSIARDNAGNVELPPDIPDTEISILGGAFEGDVSPRPNGNVGQVSVADVTQIRRFIAGLDTDFQYNEFQRTDIAPLSERGDGIFSIADIIQARRFAAGLDATIEADGPNESNAFVQSKYQKKEENLLPREIFPARISRTANKLLVEVKLIAEGNEVGVGFSLNFDPTVLSNPTNINLGTDAVASNLTVNDTQADQGRLGILIDRNPNQPFPAGTLQLVTLELDVALNSPQSTSISFGNIPIFNEVVDGTATSLPTSFSTRNIVLVEPTAASVSISGRVLMQNGRAISNAFVNMTDQSGNVRSVRTNPFGYFRFSEIEVGQTITIIAKKKGLHFDPILLKINNEVRNLNLFPSK